MQNKGKLNNLAPFHLLQIFYLHFSHFLKEASDFASSESGSKVSFSLKSFIWIIFSLIRDITVSVSIHAFHRLCVKKIFVQTHLLATLQNSVH